MVNFLLFMATVGLVLAGWAVIVPALAAARLQTRLSSIRNGVRDAQRSGRLPRSKSVETLVRMCELGIDRPRLFSFSRALALHGAVKGRHPRPVPHQDLTAEERAELRQFERLTAQAIATYMVHSSALWPILVPSARLAAVVRRLRRGRHTPGPRPSSLAADMVRVRGLGITEPREAAVTPAA